MCLKKETSATYRAGLERYESELILNTGGSVQDIAESRCTDKKENQSLFSTTRAGLISSSWFKETIVTHRVMPWVLLSSPIIPYSRPQQGPATDMLQSFTRRSPAIAGFEDSFRKIEFQECDSTVPGSMQASRKPLQVVV